MSSTINALAGYALAGYTLAGRSLARREPARRGAPVAAIAIATLAVSAAASWTPSVALAQPAGVEGALSETPAAYGGVAATPEAGAQAPQIAGALAHLKRSITPYLMIAGGIRFEDLQLRDGQTTQQRSPTVAVSRVGVRGRLGDSVSFVSAFEANAGGSLGYGASVWEGQAQLSVLDQYVQYDRCGFSAAVGRITDVASVDFYSQHIADLLLSDVYSRDPLLFSGADRGTGLWAGYKLTPRLQAGLSVHSTNPTGLTGTFLIGGELFPFDRPFSLAASVVGRNEFTLPDQNLHIYFLTPSLIYRDDTFEVKTAFQAYQLDTNMAISDDERIYGYNVRASVRARLADDRVVVFANGSRNENEMLDAMDARIKLVETYRVYTFGGGVDYAYWGPHGVGAQYVQVRQDEGAGERIVDHYVNVGTTYWLQDGLSVGMRVGVFVRDEEAQPRAFGHRSLFLTGRLRI